MINSRAGSAVEAHSLGMGEAVGSNPTQSTSIILMLF